MRSALFLLTYGAIVVNSVALVLSHSGEQGLLSNETTFDVEQSTYYSRSKTDMLY